MNKNGQFEERLFPLLGLHCAGCVANAEKILSSLEGVEQVSVNLATSEVFIKYNPQIVSPKRFVEVIASAGYKLVIPDELLEDEIIELRKRVYREQRNNTLLSLALCIPIMLLSMFCSEIAWVNYLVWGLTSVILFFSGRGFFVRAVNQVRTRHLGMDTLVTLSAGIAYLYSVVVLLFPMVSGTDIVAYHLYFESAAMIVSFVQLGKLLEERAKSNTSVAIRRLLGLQPKEVVRLGVDGQENICSIDRIIVGDLLIVRPGERIAVDGLVISGDSYIDESMLSGESVPVFKTEGDKVYTGTINQQGTLTIRAEQVGRDTMLAYIIERIRQAQSSKAPIQRLVDRVASVFVPIVMLLSVVAFIGWVIWAGKDGVSQGIVAAITVLIISCPCALGLATPMAIMVGIGRATDQGILVRDAESLEVARHIDMVVLDKTGTITEGKPIVTDVIWIQPISESYIEALLALETRSEHPLASAILTHFDAQHSSDALTTFQNIPGRGIVGEYQGQTYMAGNRILLNEQGLHRTPEQKKLIHELLNQGKTVVYFASSSELIALVAIADQPKPTSKPAIQALRGANIGVYMLTGDHPEVAASIARQVGITKIHAGVSPEDKTTFIRNIRADGKRVAMVGDGINDSAAMVEANLSIAMGKGSDIAINTAMVTIVGNDLNKITELIKLSHLTVRTIRQNLFWAFIYNLIAIPLAMGLFYPWLHSLMNPMYGSVAMVISSLCVVLNSLRIRYVK